MGPHLPPGLWTITVDVYTVRARKYTLPELFCTIDLDAVAALLTKHEYTYSFAPVEITRGEAAVPQIDRDEDPLSCADAIFEIVDSIVMPRFEQYSVLEQVIEAYAPPGAVHGSDVRAGALAARMPLPWEIMAAIAAAYLLGKLEVCEEIARKGRVEDAPPQSGIGESLGEELNKALGEFYQRYLRPRNVEPRVWIGDAGGIDVRQRIR